MFDVGFSEIVLVGVVALLVTDPKDLPAIMYKTGRFVRQFKLILRRVGDTVSDVMHDLEVESYRQQYQDNPQPMAAEQLADQSIHMLPRPAVANPVPPAADPAADPINESGTHAR